MHSLLTPQSTVCLFYVTCLSWRASSTKSCRYFTMAFTTAILLHLVLVTTVQCLPGGPVTASPEICSGSMMPQHHTKAQHTTAPYKITVPTCYKAGSSVKGALFEKYYLSVVHEIRNMRSLTKTLH